MLNVNSPTSNFEWFSDFCLSNIEAMLICIVLQSDWLSSIDNLGQPMRNNIRYRKLEQNTLIFTRYPASRDIPRDELNPTRRRARDFSTVPSILSLRVMRRMMKAAIVEKGEGLHCIYFLVLKSINKRRCQIWPQNILIEKGAYLISCQAFFVSCQLNQWWDFIHRRVRSRAFKTRYKNGAKDFLLTAEGFFERLFLVYSCAVRYRTSTCVRSHFKLRKLLTAPEIAYGGVHKAKF